MHKYLLVLNNQVVRVLASLGLLLFIALISLSKNYSYDINKEKIITDTGCNNIYLLGATFIPFFGI